VISGMKQRPVCAYHLSRVGARVRAKYLVDDEWMCRACFAGKPLAIRGQDPHPLARRVVRALAGLGGAIVPGLTLGPR